MSTFMPKQHEISRKWYVIDAAGKPLGRVAAQVAVLLRGKHKPTFAPHVDCGDHVVVINADLLYLLSDAQCLTFVHCQFVCHLFILLKVLKFSCQTSNEFKGVLLQ